jgi:hypothetical protein
MAGVAVKITDRGPRGSGSLEFPIACRAAASGADVGMAAKRFTNSRRLPFADGIS